MKDFSFKLGLGLNMVAKLRLKTLFQKKVGARKYLSEEKDGAPDPFLQKEVFE